MDEAREKQAFEVFLSHNSKDKPAVRALAALLTERGIKVWFDEEQLIPGHPWQKLMEKGVKESATGAVLVGADGLGPWENEEMQGLLQFAVDEKKPVIPVLLPGAPAKPDLPLFLRNRTWVDLRAGFGTAGMDKLIWGITGEHSGGKPRLPRASEPVIAVTRLRHGADRLVGREKELARLDTAWQDPKTHIVTIVAWGGVGKTALVVEWMAQMARDGWRGAERVFDWSFYSQGTREQGAASADTFVAKALEFFGDPEMAKGAASPWDKGARLAQLVAQKRALLVLDGVEPLQYPPGPVGGQLKTPALKALLKGLAQHNPGLCIVTTRESVTNLKPYCDTTSPEWLLEHLSEEAGAHLLFETGVKRAGSAQIRADDKELKDATREVGGHALTLQLLGRYLAKVHNGDIRRRDLVQFEKADAKVQGGHAFKVMRVYEQWLAGKGDEDALRQLAVLRLLGLFDRPADAGCLSALREKPVIAGLTEPIVGLNDDDWNYALSNLVECGLISYHEGPSQIDCHPLIREYFAKRVKDGDFWSSLFRGLLSRLFPRISATSLIWRAAHRRLYEHLCVTTKEGGEPTLEDLQPLYQAVGHGVYAGLEETVIESVLKTRIQRGNDFFSIYRLGAIQSDWSAVAHFLDRVPDKAKQCLSRGNQAFVLRQAGYCLRAMCRFAQAKDAYLASLAISRDAGDWDAAGATASLLSQLSLHLGHIAAAVEYSAEGVQYARRAAYDRLAICYTFHGDALHQAGHLDESETAFRDAERIQSQNDPAQPCLFLGNGQRFCELLLTLGRWDEVLRRLDDTLLLDLSHRAHSYLFEGLRALTRGHALIGKGSEAHSRAVREYMASAVSYFRRAGREDFLPKALLARAAFLWGQGERHEPRTDLDEAWEISERGSMKLFMADIHLHRARLFHGVTPYPWDEDEQGKPRGPKDDLAAARRLIERCGYWRRKEELEDTEEAAKSW